MKERIEQFLQQEHITASHLADTIGVQRSNVSHILSGRNKPSFDFIEKFLLAYPRVNAEWLLLGKEKMYKTVEAPAPSSEINRKSQLDLFAQVTRPIIEAPNQNKKQETSENCKENVLKEEGLSNSAAALLAESHEKEVEQVVIFYKDKTFKAYRPE